MASGNAKYWSRRITALYERYNPRKLRDKTFVDSILQVVSAFYSFLACPFQLITKHAARETCICIRPVVLCAQYAGREVQAMTQLIKKYGPEPDSKDHPQQKSSPAKSPSQTERVAPTTSKSADHPRRHFNGRLSLFAHPFLITFAHTGWLFVRAASLAAATQAIWIKRYSSSSVWSACQTIRCVRTHATISA